MILSMDYSLKLLDLLDLGRTIVSAFVCLGRSLTAYVKSIWLAQELHRINVAFFDCIYQMPKMGVHRSVSAPGGSSFLRESDALLQAFEEDVPSIAYLVQTPWTILVSSKAEYQTAIRVCEAG